MTGWQKVARHLAAALPGPGGASLLNVEFFSKFLRIKGTPEVEVACGRIRWNIGLIQPRGPFPPAAEHALALMHGDDFKVEDYWQWLMDEFGAFRGWLLGLSPGDNRLLDVLTWLMPPLASVDPAAVREFLNPEGWRSRIEADPSLTPPERAARTEFLGGYYFRYRINNLLLHVLGALASDHFSEIARYLGHPCLVGSYTHLMPHYVTSVLFQKVLILRGMAATVWAGKA